MKNISKYILIRNFDDNQIVGMHKVKLDVPISSQVRKILSEIDEDKHVIDMNGWEE